MLHCEQRLRNCREYSLCIFLTHHSGVAWFTLVLIPRSTWEWRPGCPATFSADRHLASYLCPGLKAYSAHHWIIKRERSWSNAASRKIPFHLRLSTDATGVRQTCISYGISTALERFPRGCPPHAVRSRRSDDVLPPKIALEVVLASFSSPLSSSSARKFPSFVG